MLLLLVLDCHLNHLAQFLVRLALAHHVPKRHLCVAKQAHLQVSVRSDTQAIAGAAKMVRHRGDEPNLACKTGDMIGLGGIVGVVGEFLERWVDCPDVLDQLLVRDQLVLLPLVAYRIKLKTNI